MNIQHTSTMPKTRVKKYQRNNRPRRHSTQKFRPISAVTSIGSFIPETIENKTELKWDNIKSLTSETNNTSVSSKSRQTKINRHPTKASVVRVHRPQPSVVITDQSRNPQPTVSNNMQTALHHTAQNALHHLTQTDLDHPTHLACHLTNQKPCCSKIIPDEGSKHSTSPLAQANPKQTDISISDFHLINTERSSRNSSKARNNSHSTRQTISDQPLFGNNEKDNRERSYLRDFTNENHHRRRLWKVFCPCCSPCCCLLAGPLLVLVVAGLATLITLLTLSKTTTTTTTTTTSVTTSTTTKTTTSVTTSTTTTTTTSVTTSTKTTTTTTTTTTSTSKTTSTSTTSTSVTTITTTTTTITEPTTVTITSNNCTSSWTGVSVINICNNCSNINPYEQYTYSYIAIATQTRITFAFREDIGYFALDAVSVTSISAPTVELLINGGFETGSLSPWVYCNPSSSSAPGILEQTSDNFSDQGVTYAAYSGNYYYLDGAVGNPDYLSQTFATNIGETYNISFWLFNEGSGTDSNANIIISI